MGNTRFSFIQKNQPVEVTIITRSRERGVGGWEGSERNSLGKKVKGEGSFGGRGRGKFNSKIS